MALKSSACPAVSFTCRTALFDLCDVNKDQKSLWGYTFVSFFKNTSHLFFPPAKTKPEPAA